MKPTNTLSSKSKIVLAFDSFKGCLSATDVVAAVADGVRMACPDAEIVELPLSDGGEGLATVMLQLCGGHSVSAEVHDPLGRPLRAGYVLLDDGTAVIESAAACGLSLIEPTPATSLSASTYGVGELIRDALQRSCRRIVLGLGGSATTDAGVGLLSALGFRFLNAKHSPIGTGGGALADMVAIDATKALPELANVEINLVCDVSATFYGPQGAAHVFSPQKGATPREVRILDNGLQHVAQVLLQTTGIDVQTRLGAGAAGGMAGSLNALLHAPMKPGIDYVLSAARFDTLLKGASVVLTGEGRADAQTLMGKVPAGVLRMAEAHSVPTVLLAGSVTDEACLLRAGFRRVVAATPATMPLSEALLPEVALQHLRCAAAKVLQEL